MADDASMKHEDVRWPKSRFVGVDLSASTFDNVNLRGATFLDVALSGATFRNVDLSNASIADANFEGTRIDGILVSELVRIYNQVKSA